MLGHKLSAYYLIPLPFDHTSIFVCVPVDVMVFPREIYRAPRSWIELAHPTLIYFSEVDQGCHLSAWEQPELFAEEIRAAFRSPR